jgi:hypothetical protein
MTARSKTQKDQVKKKPRYIANAEQKSDSSPNKTKPSVSFPLAVFHSNQLIRVTKRNGTERGREVGEDKKKMK